jgi:hypothetical protein
MYKIIGANQVEYGPVSADQLRQWITEGRVNAQTLVQPEGATDWRPLSQFPEFAPNFAPAPPAMPAFGAPVADEAGRAQAMAAVTGPAIGLIVTAALGFAGVLVILLTSTATFNFQSANSGNPDVDQMIRKLMGASGAVRGVLGALGSAFILFGALKMKKLEGYGLAITASIIALLPCLNPCCIVGLPIGIWALVVLNKPEVKGYFS